jgi:hypothetical protein
VELAGTAITRATYAACAASHGHDAALMMVLIVWRQRM